MQMCIFVFFQKTTGRESPSLVANRPIKEHPRPLLRANIIDVRGNSAAVEAPARLFSSDIRWARKWPAGDLSIGRRVLGLLRVRANGMELSRCVSRSMWLSLDMSLEGNRYPLHYSARERPFPAGAPGLSGSRRKREGTRRKEKEREGRNACRR